MVQGDPQQKAVYLTGAHTWAEFQDYYVDTPFPYTDWLTQLVDWNHNFMRGWTWEDDYYLPMPFNKSGSLYNLDSYNTAFFDHYRSRIQEAADSGLYVSIMLFQGWSVQDKGGSRIPDPWPRHPYKLSNNTNGINGDPNGDGEGLECHQLGISSITAKQEAYVRHFIDEFNSFDNIIWEISNESHSGSYQWQYHMVDYIHSYEATKPKQHLVWVNIGEAYIFNSSNHAEVVSPSGSTVYRTDPPAASGQKILIADSDHTGPLKVTHVWAWKNFVRGNHPILMDCSYDGLTWSTFNLDPGNVKWQRMRNALGITRNYASMMNLAEVIPQSGGVNPCSTGYCLYQFGSQYMVYQPLGGPFTIYNLPAGSYSYEWIHPYNGTQQMGTFDWIGGNRSFTPPFSGDVALFVFKGGNPIAVIDSDVTVGLKPLTVNFNASNSYDPNGGSIVSYAWDFDNDGTTDSTAQAASHTYSNLGTYTVSLTVTDNDGLTDTTTEIIRVVTAIGDFDADGDVDQEDFGHLQNCMTGNGNSQENPNCLDARMDMDDDVDSNDFVVFLGCMSGANIPQTDPGCLPD